MASQPSTLLALVLLGPAILASCAPLSPSLDAFVPACARECFLSFLAVNYPSPPCEGTTTLPCLCRQRGLSGFTVAEGLVQCIAAERAIGFCSERDGGNQAVLRAFGMCENVEGAARGTHSVFTATLILPSEGAGVVRFPPLTTTTTTTTSTRRYATSTKAADMTETLVTEPEETSSKDPNETLIREPEESTTLMSTTRRTSRTSALDTTPPVTTTSQITSSATSTQRSTSTPISDDGSDADEEAGSSDGADGSSQGDSDTLNTAQIAGLSTGLVAVALIATLLILLARHYRRKRHSSVSALDPPSAPFFRGIFGSKNQWPYMRNRNDESGSMEGVARQVNDPLSPSGGFPGAAAVAAGGGGEKGSPPAREKRSSAEEAGYDWQSWWPAAIGVAVSGDQERARHPEKEARRQSKLLPAKPVFTPPRKRSSPEVLSPTTFRNATMVAAASKPSPPRPAKTPSPAPNSHKPQPPAPLTLTIPKDVPPPARDSVFTQFEEDGSSSAFASAIPAGSQIWVPPSAHPDAKGNVNGPYYFSDAMGNWVLRSASVGKGAGEDAGGQTARRTLQPAAEITPSQASSVYSPYNPITPRPLFSGPGRTSTPARRSGNPQPPRRDSEDSGVTQFSGGSSSSSSSDPTPLAAPPPAVPGSLSPVVESPPSARPRARGNPPGAAVQQSLTPAMMRGAHDPALPHRVNQQQSQQQGDEQPRQRQGQLQHPTTATSPPTLRLVRPSPDPETPPVDRDLLPSSRHRGYPSPTPSSYNTWRPPNRQKPDAGSPSGYAAPSLPHQRAPAQQQQQQRGPAHGPHAHAPGAGVPRNNYPGYPPSRDSLTESLRTPHGRASPSAASPASSAPTTSTSSAAPSLLSKRIGPSKAATMALPHAQARPSPSAGSKWRQFPPSPHAHSPLGPGPSPRQPQQRRQQTQPPPQQRRNRQPPGGEAQPRERQQGRWALHPGVNARAAAGGEEEEGPRTPPGLGVGQSWVPRLTPTRRGDDLYLNVQ